jgi:hypothetical protein
MNMKLILLLQSFETSSKNVGSASGLIGGQMMPWGPSNRACSWRRHNCQRGHRHTYHRDILI